MDVGWQQGKMTIHEYLIYLDQSAYRVEFFEGRIYVLPSTSDNHGLIGANIGTALNNALADKPCIVFGADVKLEIETQEAIVMPDVHVMCGEPQLSKRGTGLHTNATVVVEVLSPATVAHDRGAKFHRYMLVPSLMEYLLVDQFEPRVDVLCRTETVFWSFQSYVGLDAVIHLQSLGIDLTLREIYRKVQFEVG